MHSKCRVTGVDLGVHSEPERGDRCYWRSVSRNAGSNAGSARGARTSKPKRFGGTDVESRNMGL